MEKITLFDTAIGSTNKGDEIIVRCLEEELQNILKTYFIMKAPTHLTGFSFLECLGKLPDSAAEIAASKYKFICGTNLLSDNMFHRTNQWDINLFNSKPVEGSVLVGVGALHGDQPNLYTRLLYRKVLSSQYIHSVRDEKAKKILERLHFQCVNTGCVTLWKLTTAFCSEIPIQKSDRVIFTLTDYRRDYKWDYQLITVLKKKYKNLLFWPQGVHDVEYLRELCDPAGIFILEPSVNAYEDALNNGADYVGTRMHAGIFALRHRCRSCIVCVDPRMDAIKEVLRNNCIPRVRVDDLSQMIDSNIETEVSLDWNLIQKWKDQFK